MLSHERGTPLVGEIVEEPAIAGRLARGSQRLVQEEPRICFCNRALVLRAPARRAELSLAYGGSRLAQHYPAAALTGPESSAGGT